MAPKMNTPDRLFSKLFAVSELQKPNSIETNHFLFTFSHDSSKP
jgi:hypothetical protein